MSTDNESASTFGYTETDDEVLVASKLCIVLLMCECWRAMASLRSAAGTLSFSSRRDERMGAWEQAGGALLWFVLFVRVLPIVGTTSGRVRGIWTCNREVGLGS